MILKKPYALLIKYFKLIHFILLILICYVTYNLNGLARFFYQYVKNSQIINENTIKNYLSIYSIISLIIIILFSLLMFILMNKKRKPSKFYLFSTIYYIIFLILIILAFSITKTLTQVVIDPKISRAYRDIYQILWFPNIYFIIITLIRTIGFDLKKFNFNKDLIDLDIKKEDNEEFEFILDNNSYIYKRKIHRFIREFKYYIKENKIYISIILGILLIITISYIIIDVKVINPTYYQNDTLKTNDFTYVLNKSYITNKDYTGQIIKEGKTYLITEFSIKSNYQEKVIKPENFYLKSDNKVINYKSTLSNSFIDLGILYQNNKISTNYQKYIFVFEIDTENLNNKYELVIFDKIENNENIYQKYIIKPTSIDKTIITHEQKLNETINLDNELFGSTTINIKKITISPSYQYTYEICNDYCTKYQSIELPNNTNNLLTIEYELIIDNKSIINNYINNNPTLFFDKYIKINYSQNNHDLNLSSRNYSYLNNIIFSDINKNITANSPYNLKIISRNNIYIIKIN